MSEVAIEIFTEAMVACPEPKLIQVLFCQYGDDEATTLYLGHNLHEAIAILNKQPVGDMAICTLYLDEEVYMRNDRIKQSCPPDVSKELGFASEERCNEILSLYFKERMEVQKMVFQKMYINQRDYC